MRRPGALCGICASRVVIMPAGEFPSSITSMPAMPTMPTDAHSCLQMPAGGYRKCAAAHPFFGGGIRHKGHHSVPKPCPQGGPARGLLPNTPGAPGCSEAPAPAGLAMNMAGPGNWNPISDSAAAGNSTHCCSWGWVMGRVAGLRGVACTVKCRALGGSVNVWVCLTGAGRALGRSRPGPGLLPNTPRGLPE